jgi:hypothetical protein
VLEIDGATARVWAGLLTGRFAVSGLVFGFRTLQCVRNGSMVRLIASSTRPRSARQRAKRTPEIKVRRRDAAILSAPTKRCLRKGNSMTNDFFMVSLSHLALVREILAHHEVERLEEQIDWVSIKARRPPQSWFDDDDDNPFNPEGEQAS